MTDPRITCKQCKTVMTRLEWMTNKSCEQPDCKCPEVQKLVQATQQVINKAAGRQPAAFSYVHRGAVPHGYKEGPDLYWLACPDVKVITVTPHIRKNK